MQMPSVQISYFPLRGGLNLVTPPLSMPDGMCLEALNFEVDVDGGYRRIAGYERFDGQAQPSSAVYRLINCSFSGVVSIGDTLTGATSGATGYVIAVTDTYIVLTKVTGSYVDAENLTVLGVTKAVSIGIDLEGGATSSILNCEYRHAAANVYRADILPVTGSGSILGVHRYDNNTYAFRNNVGGTEADMYVSSGAGWVKVNLGFQIEFTNANLSVEELDTLTKGAVTAQIKRVVVESGSLASGVNTGRLIIGTPAGGNFSAGAATSTGGGTLTLSGAQTAITLAPSGRYEFVNHNFGGLFNGSRMYGVSGTHQAFEFDGDVFVPIRTGMITDTPKHIIVHVNHLFLAFDGSAQHSAVGNPYSYTIINGAGELAMGDTITGFLTMVGSNATSALAVFTTNKTSILYGTGASDWQLVTYSFESGAFDYTMQSIGQGYALDALGIRQISASQDFGNFANAQVSKFIRPFIEPRVTKSIGSCIIRLRNQYRLYFNDRFALHVTFDNGKVLGIMPVKFAHSFNCIASFETNSGEEYVLAGGTDGYVYRMEKGTSFDGESIEYYVNLSFSYMKNPRSRKRFRKALYELTGNDYAEFETGYQLAYASNEVNQGVSAANVKNGGQVFWDEFVWDNFYWDGKSISPSEQDLTGTAENISLIVRGDSALFKTFTINSAIIHYTTRRMQR